MTGAPSGTYDERLRTLCEVSRLITDALAPQEALDLIASHARELLDGDAVIITSLVDPPEADDAAGLEVIAATSDARIEVGQRLPLRGSLSGKAISTRETVVANDVPGHPEAERRVAEQANVHQAVIAPMYHRDTPLGTIAVYNQARRGEFGADDAEILSALAAQAAISIHNARQFETHERRLEELAHLRRQQQDTLQRLQVLVRVGMSLNRLSLDEVLQTLVDSARDVTRAHYAALGVLDTTGTQLSRFVYSGVDEQVADRIGRLPRGGGTLGTILREARTLRLSNLHEHPDYAGFPEGHPEMHSFLGVPIRVRDRVFGNLYMTEKIGAEEFSIEDQELAELLAAQAAVAIENANLYEQRNQFFAIINHEIKNAAAGVLGWTERLQSITGESERRIADGARYAYEGAQELHKLVVDLLDLSRIEARRLELDLQDVDLRALIREVAATVRPTADRREIDMEVLGLKQRAIIRTDRTRVRQILLNLLQNAIKFSSDNGQVTLELNRRDEGWSVTVCDSGPGVDPELGDRVFEAYASSSRFRAGGSGLGLAISRQLASMLGGDLSLLDAAPGACFRLELPEDL